MSAAFVADFTDVFDRLVTLVDLLFVVVDLNIELERSSDVSATGLSNVVCVRTSTATFGDDLPLSVCLTP